MKKHNYRADKMYLFLFKKIEILKRSTFFAFAMKIAEMVTFPSK